MYWLVKSDDQRFTIFVFQIVLRIIHCRKFNVAKKKPSKEHAERDEGEFKLERNAKNTKLYWPLWTGFVGQMKRLRMHFTRECREWLAAILRREIDLRCYVFLYSLVRVNYYDKRIASHLRIRTHNSNWTKRGNNNATYFYFEVRVLNIVSMTSLCRPLPA